MGLLKAFISCWRNPDLPEPCLCDDRGDSKISLRSPDGCSPTHTANKGHPHAHKASVNLHSSPSQRPDPGFEIPSRPAYLKPVDKPLPPVPSVFSQVYTGLRNLKQVVRMFRNKRQEHSDAQPSFPMHRPDRGKRPGRCDVQPSRPTHPRSQSRRPGRSHVQSSPPTPQIKRPGRHYGQGSTSAKHPSHPDNVVGSHSRAHPSALKIKVPTSFSKFTAHSVNVVHAQRDVIMSSPGSANADQRGWQKVIEHSAPNAIHKSRALAHLGRCDEGTRRKVFRRIDEWIRPHKHPRVLCMTGAAGSGKSAIALTAAAQFEAEDLLAATFFFSSSDSTRNSSESLVFTIAYQLGMLDDRILVAIDEAVKRDPHLITASLATQAHKLILEPFQTTGVPVPPIVLIDGADECQGEEEQDRLISFITDGSLWEGTPFRFLITARPEVAIYEALKPGRCLHGSSYISLSDDKEFDATEDIKQSLSIRLQQYAVDGTLDLEGAIDAIAAASSGQYVYPATVIQYVSAGSRRGSALGRLKGIVKWICITPSLESKPRNPLHALDELYRNILSDAAEYASNNPCDPPTPGPLDKGDEVDPFFLVLQAFASLQLVTAPPAMSDPESIHDGLLGLRSGSFNSVVCDLRSLIKVRERTEAGPILQFYHRTCSEFLQDKRRAGKELYFSKSRIDAYLANRLCGVFTSSAESAVAVIDANQGLFACDETAWLNCTSASLLGGILKQTAKGIEPNLRGFQAKSQGLQKIGSLASLASKYHRFAEDGLVKATLANWASCLRAVQNSKDKELATLAGAVLGVIAEALQRYYD